MSWLLHVEFRSAVRLPVDVPGDGREEAFGITGHVSDDQRVAPTLLQDAHVLTLLHQVL